MNRERNLFGSDFEIRLRNRLTQRAIAKECADWIRRKARFKTNITHGSMNSFLNIRNEEETYTYMPFNEFTTTELGLDRGNNICPMVVGMPGHRSTDMFLNNFNELWKDKEKFQDVTENVIENIETVYKENAPAFIYFITLYNIFNEFWRILTKMSCLMRLPDSKTVLFGTNFIISKRRVLGNNK